MISLRLNSDLEKDIETTAETIGVSKSEFVRNSILEYLEKIKNNNPWDLGKDLFAKYGSGKRDLSENVSSLFKEKIKNQRK